MQFDLLEMECMVYQAEECMECSRARPPAGTHDAVLRATRVCGGGRDAAREEAVVLRVEVHHGHGAELELRRVAVRIHALLRLARPLLAYAFFWNGAHQKMNMFISDPSVSEC